MKVTHAIQGLSPTNTSCPIKLNKPFYMQQVSQAEVLERSSPNTSHSFRGERIPILPSFSKRKMICNAPMSSVDFILVDCHQRGVFAKQKWISRTGMGNTERLSLN